MSDIKQITPNDMAEEHIEVLKRLRKEKDLIDSEIKKVELLILSDIGYTESEFKEQGESVQVGEELMIVPGERVSVDQSLIVPIVEQNPDLIGTQLKYEYKLINKEFAGNPLLQPAIKRTKIKPAFKIKK